MLFSVMQCEQLGMWRDRKHYYYVTSYVSPYKTYNTNK